MEAAELCGSRTVTSCCLLLLGGLGLLLNLWCGRLLSRSRRLILHEATCLEARDLREGVMQSVVEGDRCAWLLSWLKAVLRLHWRVIRKRRWLL